MKLTKFTNLKIGNVLTFTLKDASQIAAKLMHINRGKRRLTFEMVDGEVPELGILSVLYGVPCKLTHISERGRLTFTPMVDNAVMPVDRVRHKTIIRPYEKRQNPFEKGKANV